jgi:hypothetical protein
VRLADQQVLQRHAERFRRVRLFPGVGPLVLEQPGRLAAVDPGPHGVRGRRREQRLLDGGRRGQLLVLPGEEPGRAHPGPDRAEGERCRDLAAAADTARGEDGRLLADCVDDLRDQDHGGDLAGVPARLVALGDHDVHAAGDLPAGVLGLPGQRGDQHAALVRAGDDVGRRRAERVRDQPGRMAQRDLDVLARDRVQPAEHAVGGLGAVRQRRDAEPEQGLLDEVLMGGRDQLAEVGLPALGRDPGGHDHVDAVRAAVGVPVHPVQDGVQFGRVVEADAAQHAEAAGPADRGGDVLGRGEADDGVLDAEQVAERGGDRAAHRRVSRAGSWAAAYSRAQP